MTLSTYAGLKATIADFLNREDLTASIASFVSLAEAQINRDVRHWRMEKRADATFDEGFEDIPADWVQTVRLAKADGQEIRLCSNAEILAYRTANAGATGDAVVYTMTAGQFEIFPVPGSTAQLIYMAKIPALSDSNTTNWLLLEAPDVYLYGSLMHSAPYLKDDGRVSLWTGIYTAAVSNLNMAGETAKHSGPLRMRMP